jgi:hypothetical protein
MYRVKAATLSVGTKGEAATVWLLERCQSRESESREAEDLLGRGPGGAYFDFPPFHSALHQGTPALLNELFENDGLIAIHDEP